MQRVRSTCLADQQCSTMFNKVCNVPTVKVLYSVQCPCKSCLGHSSNVRPNGQGTQYSHTAHTNSPPMCCCVSSAICCESQGGRLAHIVQLCDEVNADLMTGHGAHAFNQTYQPPRRHPVLIPSACSVSNAHSPPTSLRGVLEFKLKF